MTYQLKKTQLHQTSSIVILDQALHYQHQWGIFLQTETVVDWLLSRRRTGRDCWYFCLTQWIMNLLYWINRIMLGWLYGLRFWQGWGVFVWRFVMLCVFLSSPRFTVFSTESYNHLIYWLCRNEIYFNAMTSIEISKCQHHFCGNMRIVWIILFMAFFLLRIWIWIYPSCLKCLLKKEPGINVYICHHDNLNLLAIQVRG